MSTEPSTSRQSLLDIIAKIEQSRDEQVIEDNLRQLEQILEHDSAKIDVDILRKLHIITVNYSYEDQREEVTVIPSYDDHTSADYGVFYAPADEIVTKTVYITESIIVDCSYLNKLADEVLHLRIHSALSDIATGRTSGDIIYLLAPPHAPELIQSLKQIGLPAIIAIRQLLQHTDRSLRFNAVEVLQKIGDSHAVELLCDVLKRTSCNATRGRAARTLGVIADVRAVVPLCKTLHDQDQYLHDAAADALTMMGDVSSLPRKVMSSEALSAIERYHALEALSEAETGKIFKKLRYSVRDAEAFCKRLSKEDADPKIRDNAAEVLTLLTHLRPSERPGRDTLLRPATDDGAVASPEHLLRASSPSYAPNAKQKRKDFWRRLFARLFRRKRTS